MNSNTSGENGLEAGEEKIVSVTEKGQATIPKAFREELGIETPDKVKFRKTEMGYIVVEPVLSARRFRGVLASEEGLSGIEILREGREEDEKQSAEKFTKFIDNSDTGED